MISTRLTCLLFFIACAAHIATSAGESEDPPAIRIIANKNPKKGASSPSDMNAACMMYNNDAEECLLHRECTALPMDKTNTLCLSKAYISSIVGAIAKGDAKVVPTKSIKKRCDDVPDGATCKRTAGCEVFKFNEKEVCAPKEGGYEINKQDIDFYVFETANEVQANVLLEHINVLDSSVSSDQWNLFGGVRASGNAPFYQLAGISYEVGNVFEAGLGSRVTDDEITFGYTGENEISNNFVFGLPFLQYSAGK